jgi:hypothetical protein
MNDLDDHGSEYVGSSAPILWPDREAGPWALTLHWADIDGLTECVGIDVRGFIEQRDRTGRRVTGRRTAHGGKAQPITARAFREVNVGAVVRDERQATWEATSEAHETGEGVAGAFIQALGLDPETVRHPSDKRRAWSSRDLKAVAAVYLEALNRKQPPRKAVSETFGVSGSMASKLLRQARDAGLLGEAPGPGKAGGASKGGKA